MRAALLLLLAPLIARADGPPLSVVGFGSCSHQDRPQLIWDAVLRAKPELFLLLGDNIYADTDDMKLMKEKYDRQDAVPGFAKFRAACPLLATWDDHDLGKNDAGSDYPQREASQKLFCDFFRLPADAPPRQRKGVYDAKVFGPPGKRVQVIMLDTRYFRSPIRRGARPAGYTYTPYIPNTDPDATVLGTEQWVWLAEQLRVPAEVRLLVSSIQCVAEDHGFEKWTNIPAERVRLLKLIRDTQAAGVVILSGDRHLAELSVLAEGVDYPLYDLTSSGLNMGYEEWRAPEVNRHRVAAMPFGHNFGVVTIDWADADPKLGLVIRDVDGDVAVRHKLRLSDLKPGALTAAQAKASVEQPTPGEGAIGIAEARGKVGMTVTLEMRVISTGRTKDGPAFLNSEADRGSSDNFVIMVRTAAAQQLFGAAGPNKVKGKVVRVTGRVSEYKGRSEIVVEDAAQVKVLP